MKFLFASDSFKGSLSSREIGELLTKAAKQCFPDCETITVPVADGGEGTLAAMVDALNGKVEMASVHGPLMEPVEAEYGILNARQVILEAAMVIGLPMVPETDRNPLETTSFGLGELIKMVMEAGYREITIALGGSATNDGGIGALHALGVEFYDVSGSRLTGFGKDLSKIVSMDISNLHPLIKQTTFKIMSDVTNPFTGQNGATFTYGAQKGGDAETLALLEEGMQHFKQLLMETCKIDLNAITGSGAAGGLGGSLVAFLKAEIAPGIEIVLDELHFDELLKDVDLVVTGEGRMDWQSAFGKVPSGIARRSRAKQIPVVAIVGSMGTGAEAIYQEGVTSIVTTVNGVMTLTEALENAETLYENAAIRMFRLLRI